MNTWIQKTASTILVVLVLGAVFFPFATYAQPFLPEYAETQTPDGTGTVLLDDTNTQTPETITHTGSNFTESQSSLPACGLVPGDDGTVEGCVVRMFYYVILYPSAWIANLGGSVFDYFIAYSLDSKSYSSGGFVEKGWVVVRDLANASFIFMLLYIAITFVVGGTKATASKLLTRVILIAVVINFSLFATRIIIDAGNILARVFYEKIIVENDDTASSNGYSTLSAGLLGYINPQKLLTSDMFNKQITTTTAEQAINNNTLGVLDEPGQGTDGNINSGFMILIILLASVVNLVLAYVFFSVGIFFVARTLGLWFMMILSPIAFASYSIPVLTKIKRLGFSDWLKETTSLAFMGVIFMFFLFLTIMFLDIAFSTAFSGVSADQGSTIQKMMGVMVPFVAVVFLLLKAQGIAKSMSGEFGEMAMKGLKYSIMGALGGAGLALGATALAGGFAMRQTVGRAGGAWAKNADTRTAAGRLRKRLGTAASKSSFDARNIKIPKPIGKVAGWGKTGLSYATGGAVSAGDFNLKSAGTGTTQGGYSQRKEEYMKKKIESAKELAPTEDTKVDVNGTSMSTNDAQKILDRKRIEAKQSNDYDEKVIARDKQKIVLDETKRDYDTALREFSQGKITDIELASIKRSLDAVNSNHETKKTAVEAVSNLWKSEEIQFNDAKKAFAKQKTEFFKNYSESVSDWASFPDGGLTHRYGANKDAANEIENMGLREEKKNENK